MHLYFPFTALACWVPLPSHKNKNTPIESENLYFSPDATQTLTAFYVTFSMIYWQFTWLCCAILAWHVSCCLCTFDHVHILFTGKIACKLLRKEKWPCWSLILACMFEKSWWINGPICQDLMVWCQGDLDSVRVMIHRVVFSVPFRQHDTLLYPFISAVIYIHLKGRCLQEAIHQDVKLFILAHRIRKATTWTRTEPFQMRRTE